MAEYTDAIREQEIIYEDGTYLVCHPASFPNHIHVYHLCTYKPCLATKSKTTWLNCGTWYRKDDGKYYDSDNAYGWGLGSAETVDEIVSKISRKNCSKEQEETK